MSQPENTAAKTVTTVRQTFNKGTTKDLNHRKTALTNLVNFFKDHEQAIIDSIFADSRRHKEEARFELFTAVGHFRHVVDNFATWAKPEKASKRLVDFFDGLWVYNEPYGVVLLMTCWNMPILTLIPIAGAIAAGNCVVVKPSHNGPNFGRLLATVLPKYLDPECYPVFWGKHDDVGELLEQRFDYIYFTGSPSVGRIIHRAANRHLTPTTLQLGGKNPVFIDSSADLEQAAARIIWGKCLNSGQVCSAPDYVLCSKLVREGFIKHAKLAIRRFFPDSEYCPIVNHHHFHRLSKFLQGLDVEVGGGVDNSDLTIQPTIAINVSPDHPIMEEEIFGPILPIVTIDNMEEAVDFINKREKPLVVYVFAKETSVKDFFIDKTSSGAVTINDTLVHVITKSLPFGGVGSSGMGRYKGKYVTETFVNKKSVLDKNTSRLLENFNELRYPPLTRRKNDLARFFLDYRWGPSSSSILHTTIFVLGLGAGFVLFYIAFVLNPRFYQ